MEKDADNSAILSLFVMVHAFKDIARERGMTLDELLPSDIAAADELAILDEVQRRIRLALKAGPERDEATANAKRVLAEHAERN